MNSSRKATMYSWRSPAMRLAVSVFIMSFRRRSFSWKWLTVVPTFEWYSPASMPILGPSPGMCMARPRLPP